MAAAIQAAKETLANPARSVNDGGATGTTNYVATTTTTTQPLASPNSSNNPSTTSANATAAGGRRARKSSPGTTTARQKKKGSGGGRIGPGCRVYAKKKYLYHILQHDCQRQPLEKLHNNCRLFGTVISGNTNLGWGCLV